MNWKSPRSRSPESRWRGRSLEFVRLSNCPTCSSVDLPVGRSSLKMKSHGIQSEPCRSVEHYGSYPDTPILLGSDEMESSSLRSELQDRISRELTRLMLPSFGGMAENGSSTCQLRRISGHRLSVYRTIGPSSTAVARRSYHAGINDKCSIYCTANRVCKQVSEGPVDPSDPGLVGQECLKGYST